MKELKVMNVAKAHSGSSRTSLVWLGEGKIRATDAFIAIERNIPYAGPPVCVEKEALAKLKGAGRIEKLEAQSVGEISAVGDKATVVVKTEDPVGYPELGAIFPEAEGSPTATLSAKLLRKLIEACDGVSFIDLFVEAKNRPVALHLKDDDGRQVGRGLIMPIRGKEPKA